MNIKSNQTLIGICLVIFAAIIIFPWLDRPFTGHHDFTGAFDSQMAKNYLRYGLIKTKLGQVTNFGTVAPTEFTYHTHHPPGIILWLAGAFKLFGEQESVARSATAIFSLGSVFLFFLLVSKSTSAPVAIIANIFLSTLPLFVYPSILPVYEAPAMFLMLLQFYSFHQFTATKKTAYLALFIFAIMVGNITAWATYFVLPILIINEITLRRKEYLKLLFCLIILGIGFFGLHLIHTKLLTGSVIGGGLQEVLMRRVGSGNEESPDTKFSLGTYIVVVMKRMKNFHGWPMILSAVAGFAAILAGKNTKAKHLLLLLTGTALSLPLVFKNYVYVHDYILFYTTPLVALAAGIGFWKLLNLLAKKYNRSQPITWTQFLIALAAFLITNYYFNNSIWQGLRESVTWYEASLLIGRKLNNTTRSGQSILIMNQKLRNQETQLAYYADRAIEFPVGTMKVAADMGTPDVIVTVLTDLNFRQDVREDLLKNYRLETDYGVEYYYKR